MTPVWIAIAALTVAVLGLMVTLITYLVNHAYKMGLRDQRIAALEARPHDDNCATQLAAMTERLTALKEATERRLDELGDDIRSIRPQTPARTRAAK